MTQPAQTSKSGEDGPGPDRFSEDDATNEGNMLETWPMPELLAADLRVWLLSLLERPGLIARRVGRLQRRVAAVAIVAMRAARKEGYASAWLRCDRHRYLHRDWSRLPDLIAARLLHKVLVAESRLLLCLAVDLPRERQQRLRLWLRQWEAVSCPAYHPWISPEVRERATETRGQSLRQGLVYWHEDVTNRKVPRLRKQPKGAFTLGHDIATTPGFVVAQNTLMQLIRYEPATSRVFTTPLLIVPPCINKYYILDIDSQRSFVGWLVAQGFVVYLISWVNPGREHANCGIADYVRLGPGAAAAHIAAIEGVNEIDLLGYCVGGFLARLWAVNAGAPQASVAIRRLTLLTTTLDFEEPGDIGAFLSGGQHDALAARLEHTGLLEARTLRQAFAMLDPERLLVAPAWRRYGLGEPPRPHDLIWWSEDGTDLPARFAIEYWQLYESREKPRPAPGRQLLRQSGGSSELNTYSSAFGGPVYALAATDDKIVPWQSAFAGIDLFGGTKRVVLAHGGHIGAVLATSGNAKSGFAAIDLAKGNVAPPDVGNILLRSKMRPGSWWQDWLIWSMREEDGQGRSPAGQTAMQPARYGDQLAVELIEPAPGGFVHANDRESRRNVE